MVINRTIGLSMAEQVDRVNSGQPVEERLREAQQQIRNLQWLLQQRDQQVKELRQRAEAAESQPSVIRGIIGQHGPLTTPAKFARLHSVSISTVNRALNARELLGVRQPNQRWLVYEDQPWIQKRKRG